MAAHAPTCARRAHFAPAGRVDMKATVVGFVALALAGCATVAPPTERMAKTEGSIRGATEVGAASVPRASLHLRLAHDQLQIAKSLMTAGDHHEAALMLMRSQADAELALQLSREAQARASSQQADSELKYFQSNTSP
jgi:hypothetical protein